MQGLKIKILTGVVISRSGDKSVKVVIEYKVKHPRYGKYIRKRTNYGVHDEQNVGGVGDMVEFTLDYMGTLRLINSRYIDKRIITD